MSAKKVPTLLYTDVVNITYDYLGPAADRFVTRQIRNHLGKAPEQLQKKDLRDLISWIKIAMTLLTDDEKLIRRYVSDLRKISA